jgi:hypothetical protein
VLPTLGGRIQTRIALLAVIGGLVTLIITPFLPLPAGTTLSHAYRDTFIILIAVAVIGIVWECLYHLVMQWRWEKVADLGTAEGEGNTGNCGHGAR